MPIPPEDAVFLKSQGWSDAEIANAQPINQPTTQPIGTLGTIGDTARAHIGSYAGGGLGAIGGGALVGALGGSEVPVVGNIIGGILGALAGAYGGQKLQQGVDPGYEQAQQTAQSAASQNPITAGATDIAGSALASGGMFSPTTAIKGVRSILGRLGGNALDDAGKQVLLQSALNPAINTGLSLAQGQGLPSLQDLVTQSIGGGLFAKSWLPHGESRASDEPKSEVNNAENTQLLGNAQQPFGLLNQPRRFYGGDSGVIDINGAEEPKQEVNNQEKGPLLLNAPSGNEVIPQPPTTFTHDILQQIIDKGATKPISVQRIFPKLNLTTQEANEALRQADLLAELHINNQPESENQDATGIRENTGQPNQTGEVARGSQEDRGNDVVETPSRSEDQPIPPRESKTIPNQPIVNNVTGKGNQKVAAQQVERDPTLHLPYSPEDLAKYKEMQPKTIPTSLEQYSSPEFQNTLKDYEALRNKYNGNPPLQVVQERNAAKAEALAQKLESFKSGAGNGQLHAFGILPAVWDGAISAAQAVIRGGGKIADAIQKAIEHIKANWNSKDKLDEDGVRSALASKLSESPSPAELNLPKDKYMGKFGNMFRAVIDKVRDIGTPEAKNLGDNMQKAVDRETELKGKWKNMIVQRGEELSAADKKKLMDVFNHELETGTSGVTMLNNQKQRAFYNLARAKLDESGKYRLNIGEPVTMATKTKNGGNLYVRRNLKQDPFYFPGMANQRVLDVYRKGTDHEAITKLDKEFHDYNTKKLGLTEEGSRERIENFKKSVQGSLQKSDISHQDYFNAHRKAQGIPLPPAFREQDPVRNLERYFDRAAVDASHYEFLEKDPKILATLGQTKDAWGNDVPKANNVLANNQAVKAGLEHWRGEAHNPAEAVEKSTSALLSASMISGPPLEGHKIISNVVSTAKFADNPIHLVNTLYHGMTNIGKGYQHAVENGVVKLTARSVSQMLSGSSTASERLQATSRLIRRIATLNDLTTKFGAGLVQSMNEVIVPSKVVRANAGDVTAQLFVRRLDPSYTIGKQYSPLEMQQLASRSANYIHGTGDIRSLPAWMLNDSEFSGFFSLAHWSIAQTNNFMKDVYEPATRGDIKPLLTGIFGAAIGGYLIKELRQDIQGKKNPIPSLSEIAASDRGLKGNSGLLAYNAIAAMQYSGFGGLLSQIAKYPFDAVYKNQPMGATFPLDEIASDLAGTLHNVQEAIANDPQVNWLDLAKAVSSHVLSTDFQLSRIAINQGIDRGLITGLPAEKKELSDKLGQLRRFDMTEGLPYNDIDESGNPYMNLEQKKFKMNQDLSSSVQQLPDLLHGIISKYSASPDVMMQKIKALKQNPYSTFPSMEDTPLSFFKYIGYLSREEGPAKAQSELMDYLRHKTVNEAKSSLVP